MRNPRVERALREAPLAVSPGRAQPDSNFTVFIPPAALFISFTFRGCYSIYDAADDSRGGCTTSIAVV